MSETPTTTTSQKSIAIHLQFVLQYASNLYCSASGAPTLSEKGNTVSTPPIGIVIRLPFVLQYPWPSNPCLFEKNTRETPKKAKVFFLCRTPKTPKTQRKNAPKKQGKSEKEKSQELQKSKDWRVRDAF